MSLYHIGSALSRVDLKLANRLAENLLITGEKLSVMAALSGGEYPEYRLDKAWRQLLCGQHHDSITGTHNEISYLDLLPQYREAVELGRKIVDDATEYLARNVRIQDSLGAFLVFNPHAWQRKEAVTLHLEFDPASQHFVDWEGRTLPMQVSGSGKDIAVTVEIDAPPMGYTAVYLKPGAAETTAQEKADGECWIENDYFVLRVDPEQGGAIVELFDKKFGKQVLNSEAAVRGNTLCVLCEDERRNEALHEFYTTGEKTFSTEYRANVRRIVGSCVQQLIIESSIGEICRMRQTIHSATRWATLSNYHSIPTDCPHREQNGWTGDAQLSAEQALMNFDMVAAYEKWLSDFRDVQRPSGQIPGIVPSAGWGYNWGSGPAWDSALILIPLYVWRYTKCDRILRNMWDCMERYMQYMGSMADDYIVDFGLGDWCPPATTVPCPSVLTDTAYYYADAMAMAEAAEVIGKDGAAYRLLADRVRAAFRKKFLKNGLPVPESQTSLACVIFQGLLDPDEKAPAAARLAELVKENDYHIDCGILGTKYIFRALSDFGYDDVLYSIVTNPTGPSYANWILHGMTTLCEDWAMKESLNHHMFSEVDLWFYRSLAGIHRDEDELVIAPSFVEGLDWVQANHKDVSVSWNAEKIVVTVNENARLVLPDREIRLIPGTTVVGR